MKRFYTGNSFYIVHYLFPDLNRLMKFWHVYEVWTTKAIEKLSICQNERNYIVSLQTSNHCSSGAVCFLSGLFVYSRCWHFPPRIMGPMEVCTPNMAVFVNVCWNGSWKGGIPSFKHRRFFKLWPRKWTLKSHLFRAFASICSVKKGSTPTFNKQRLFQPEISCTISPYDLLTTRFPQSAKSSIASLVWCFGISGTSGTSSFGIGE